MPKVIRPRLITIPNSHKILSSIDKLVKSNNKEDSKRKKNKQTVLRTVDLSYTTVTRIVSKPNMDGQTN